MAETCIGTVLSFQDGGRRIASMPDEAPFGLAGRAHG